MKNKSSPLYSLADSFEYRPSKLNSFETLGCAPLGDYHIAVFFRNIVSSALTVDHTTPIRATKYCTIYNIQNNRGSVYGILFTVPQDKFRINNGILIVGGSESCGAFAVYPFADAKRNLTIYIDDKDNLLANLGTVDYNPLVVFDAV